MADISVSSPGVGPWIPLEPSEALETFPGGNEEARARLEPAGVVRLTGALRVRAGHIAHEGELLASLPPEVRTKPAKVLRLPVATLNEANRGLLALQIETVNGQITLLPLSIGVQLLAGETLFLETSYSTT